MAVILGSVVVYDLVADLRSHACRGLVYPGVVTAARRIHLSHDPLLGVYTVSDAGFLFVIINWEFSQRFISAEM